MAKRKNVKIPKNPKKNKLLYLTIAILVISLYTIYFTFTNDSKNSIKISDNFVKEGDVYYENKEYSRANIEYLKALYTIFNY